MTDWRFADVYEAISAAVPQRPCLIQNERMVTWGDIDGRAGAIAADLVAAGLEPDAKVARYLYSCPAYLETVFAAFKARLVSLNTNFRCGREECSTSSTIPTPRLSASMPRSPNGVTNVLSVA